MTVDKRIRVCLLIERMNENKKLAEKLGVEDISKIHGKRIENKGERIC